jgi:hypothetical protein
MHRTLLVLALVLFALPVAAAKPIEDFHLEADGKDWTPAFERAQQQCQGCTIELGPGVYPLAKTVNVCWPLSLRGQGVSFAGQGSRVTISRQTAFQTWTKAEKCPFTGAAAAGGFLEIEHLSILQTAVSAPAPGEVPYHGVATHGRVLLVDLFIQGFVHGIDMTCSAPTANCNTSRIFAVDIQDSGHAGVYIQGDNASASTLLSVRADKNCAYAASWNAQYIAPLCSKVATIPNAACSDTTLQCAGVMDDSFLGNVHVGHELASEKQLSPVVYYPGLVLQGAVQDSTAVGVYVEGAIRNWADGHALVLGGTNGFAGAAGQWHGNWTPGFTIAAGGIKMDFGFTTNMNGVAYALGNAATAGRPWRLKLNDKGDMVSDVGNALPIRGLSPYAP